MELFEETKAVGSIICSVEYKDNRREVYRFQNTVLLGGRTTLAEFLALPIPPKRFITFMVFGDGGYDPERGGKRIVETSRRSLFGLTRVNKPVIAQIDPANPTQVIFTSAITHEEGNGQKLNEMALMMNDETLFSMATFPDLHKTDQMQIVWNWRISFC